MPGGWSTKFGWRCRCSEGHERTGLRVTAAALQEMIDLDLDAIAAIQPPLGYGRD
jgi:hypothetical protein